jgi:hypothetical protein
LCIPLYTATAPLSQRNISLTNNATSIMISIVLISLLFHILGLNCLKNLHFSAYPLNGTQYLTSNFNITNSLWYFTEKSTS